VARSCGRGEEFLAGWLAGHGHADVIAGLKWGYRSTGGWRLETAYLHLKKTLRGARRVLRGQSVTWPARRCERSCW
jgi:hypothetical protein